MATQRARTGKKARTASTSHSAKKSGAEAARPKTVVVAGDVVVDHHIYQGARDKPYAHAKEGTAIYQERGGAELVFKVLQKLAPAVPEPFAAECGMGSTPKNRLVESFSLLSPCPAGGRGKGLVWRVTGNLGYGDSPEHTTQYAAASARPAAASVVVLDDGALGFRHLANERAWPAEIRGDKPAAADWIVLKTSAPVGQGDLWWRVCRRFCEKLVVVVSASDLRQEEVSIAEGLSWERTAQDLLQELALNKSISDLTKCRHLVVALGTDGALWLAQPDGGSAARDVASARSRLVFDPGSLEGAWARGVEGRVWGGMSCLVAAIAAELASSYVAGTHADKGGDADAGPDIGAAIVRGLSAMRHLLTVGHGAVDGGDSRRDRKARHGFPPAPVVDELLRPSCRYRVADIPGSVATAGRSKDWTIVSGPAGVTADRPLRGLGRRVALFGPKALVDQVPYARFGKLLLVDRAEIESLRGLERLVRAYERDPRPKKPLSIAVFGAPGSGKSFSVKQVAKTVLGKDVPVLVFNLSQFSDPGELIGAFHQVRDKVLEGITPVVFWDEFDSREYMWLQYLLAPMQDGAFQEGQITHPIGKCVFVFAGGTSYDFANFSPPEEAPSDSAAARGAEAAAGGGDQGLSRIEKFKLAKGPDFVSRLNGYLNVAGPNPRQKYDADRGEWVDDDAPRDLTFPVRRALLMRATGGLVGAAEGDEMDIDSGLLTALLEVGRFRHGARSLETIMTLTRGAATAGIRRSALPPQDQLSLHVDYDEFMGLVNRDRPFGLYSEQLAPVVHEFFRQLCRKEDWPIAYDRDYDDLPEGVKADNIAAAARIPRVLALAGLAVVSEDHPETLAPDEVRRRTDADLESLAECEHEGYMEQRYRDGWTYGPVLDHEAKLHPCLVPYAELSEENKQKDRDTIRHYPDIVKLAGFRIVEAGSAPTA